ncbi:MAG: DegT/DnrJ/EryC1/StrS family aminotransferase [Candidatus Dormiibacterota bacterium]
MPDVRPRDTPTHAPHPADGFVTITHPAREYEACRQEIDEAIARVLQSGRYVLDEELLAFETEFAAYIGRQFAVGVSSGTAALKLALLAAGLDPGGEVITTPNSDSPASTAITHAGLAVVWADIDPRTFNLSPTALEAKISPRTRAVIPVHLFGQPAAMDEILEICRRHHLLVIEDAATATGAMYHGTKTGNFGDVACFSFAPSKPLGGVGDGGMVVTDDAELDRRLRILRNYGHVDQGNTNFRDLLGAREWQVVLQGFNERLDSLHAAILRAKLVTLEGRLEARRRIASAYNEAFSALGDVQVPYVVPETRHVYYAYNILVEDQGRFRRGLAKLGVASRLYYTPPLHLQPAFEYLGQGPGAFPAAEDVGLHMVGLPVFPLMSDSEIARVISAVVSQPATRS